MLEGIGLHRVYRTYDCLVDRLSSLKRDSIIACIVYSHSDTSVIGQSKNKSRNSDEGFHNACTKASLLY